MVVKCLQPYLFFFDLQLNTGIAQATENKSSFILGLNSSALFLGNAIGSSLAAVVITLGGIQNIVFISLLTSIGINLIQFISNKKFSVLEYKNEIVDSEMKII